MDAMVGTVRVLGETLLHFLWQGALIGVLAALALKAASRRTAHYRYLICLAALFACFAAPILTATFIIDSSSPLVLPASGHASIASPTGASRVIPAIAHAAPVAAQPSFDLMRVIVGIWLLGVLAVTTYYGLQWRGVDRVRRNALPFPVTGPLAAVAKTLLRRWNITSKVPVLISELVHSPMVIGVIRPIIVFPAATLARMPAADFELILLHEIAHIIRRDTWLNAMQVFLEIVFFYHPAVHWLSRRARLERECACDDFVVAASGSAYQYAQALTTLALAHNHKETVALAATGGDLLPRLRYLAGECIDGESYPRNPLQFALLGLLFGLIWMHAFIEPLRSRLSDKSIVVAMQAELANTRLPPVESITFPEMTLPWSESRSFTVASQGSAQSTQPAEAANTQARSATAEAPEARRASTASDQTAATRAATAMVDAGAISEAATPSVARADGTMLPGEITEPAPAAPEAAVAEAIAPAMAAPAETPVTQTTTEEAAHALAPSSNAEPGAPLSVTTTSSPMPEYPLRARLDGIEGKVSAIVRVGPNGRPKGLQIVSAEPLGVFEGSVRRALMQWRYDLSNMPAASKNMEVAYQLNFTISGVASTATGICATATASRTCLPR
jgi:bla regulator protein blaR1